MMVSRFTKYLRACERESEALTRDGGWISAQIVLKPSGCVAYNGENEFTRWAVKTLSENGLQAQLDHLSFSGHQLNYLSSEQERSRQLKVIFKTSLPPFPIPFSQIKTNLEIREAWTCLWNAISSPSRRYGGDMPEGWGEEHLELWKVFSGAANGARVITKMKEMGVAGNFTTFVKDRIRGIYLAKLGSEEKIEEFHMENLRIPYLKHDAVEQEVPEEEEEEVAEEQEVAREQEVAGEQEVLGEQFVLRGEEIEEQEVQFQMEGEQGGLPLGEQEGQDM